MKRNGLLSTVGLVTALSIAAVPTANAQIDYETEITLTGIIPFTTQRVQQASQLMTSAIADEVTELTLTGLSPRFRFADVVSEAEARGYQEWARVAEMAGVPAFSPLGYTVFVADDADYQRIPSAHRQAYMSDPAGQREAVGVTIVAERLTFDDLRNRQVVTTIDGRRLPVVVDGDRVWIAGALVERLGGNGDVVIHEVDRVLMPFGAPVQ